MKRSSLLLEPSWQALDPTPSPGLPHQIGPAALSRIKAWSGGNFDTDYFSAMVGGTVYDVLKKNGITMEQRLVKGMVLGTVLWASGTTGRSSATDVQPLYKQGNPLNAILDPGGEIATFSAPTSLSRGNPLVFTTHLQNGSTQAMTVYAGFTLYRTTGGGVGPQTTILDPLAQTLTLVPSESRDLITEIPWGTVAPWATGDFGFLLLFSVATADHSKISVADVSISVREPQTILTLAPTGTVRFNDLVTYSASFSNSTPSPVSGQVRFRSGGGLRFANNSKIVSAGFGSVGVGQAVTLTAIARAARKGDDMASVDIETPAFWSYAEPSEFTVVGCLGDLDGGDSVDDADFSIFVQSYDALLVPPADPAADLNRDGIVDDADFTLFVQAYDKLTCD